MSEPFNKDRLRWACRRGMLELDLILENYLNKHYQQANKEEQQQFIDLLEQADQDLFDWIVKKQEPKEQNLKSIITTLIKYGAKT